MPSTTWHAYTVHSAHGSFEFEIRQVRASAACGFYLYIYCGVGGPIWTLKMVGIYGSVRCINDEMRLGHRAAAAEITYKSFIIL